VETEDTVRVEEEGADVRVEKVEVDVAEVDVVVVVDIEDVDEFVGAGVDESAS
jgi:hypothetical protein